MANWDLKDRAAITGVGNSKFGRRLMRSPIDLAAEAILNALDDCGLQRKQLDGLIVSFGSLILSAGLAHALGGLAAVSFSGMRRPMMGGGGDREGSREAGGGHGEDPVYGMTSPGAGAAMVARRYFERYGTDSRALASVPIAFRKHASRNPLAIMREPFDVEEHQRSRYVCEPLHLLDYCLINDGAACVIVTNSERARDCRKHPVYLSGMQALPTSREEFIWAYPGLGVAQQSVFDYKAELH